MITIDQNIETIEGLIAKQTPSSITYAALECRLTIEQICYERLRICHDYISHSDLLKWQPQNIVKQLIQDVDPYLTSDMKFSISQNSVEEDKGKSPNEIDYIQVGEQKAFNAKKLGKLWNALSKIALHIQLPEDKSKSISRHENYENCLSKIKDCLEEFKKISGTSMVFSGFGEQVSFTCFGCDNLNKRKSHGLEAGKVISCITADCDEKYEVQHDDNSYRFERKKVKFECKCGYFLSSSESSVLKLKYNQQTCWKCSNCNRSYALQWKLSVIEET